MHRLAAPPRPGRAMLRRVAPLAREGSGVRRTCPAQCALAAARAGSATGGLNADPGPATSATSPSATGSSRGPSTILRILYLRSKFVTAERRGRSRGTRYSCSKELRGNVKIL